MTSLTGDGCQSNESNSLFPIESLRFPLDSSMRIVFTGYYNGFSVEVRSPDEGALLYHMGCFGKGSASRSKPRQVLNDGNPTILRQRQFQKRNSWAKKFRSPPESNEFDTFFKDAKNLNSKIVKDAGRRVGKDVIDLVSSDEELSNAEDETEDNNDTNPVEIVHCHDNRDVVVIVQDSDSEGDNYFNNLKPKCCYNSIKIQEKLMLTLQEAFFLVYGLGCLHVVNFDNRTLNIQQCWDLFEKTDKNFIPKYVVYHYFRAKGYVVKPGIKFGGDYLLYKESPEMNHASHIVIVRTETDFMKQDWVSVLGHVRMAVTTVKEILIAEVIEPETPQTLPEGLCHYTVREMLLSRKMPVSIKEDDD